MFFATFGGRVGRRSGDTPHPGKGLRPLHPLGHLPGFRYLGTPTRQETTFPAPLRTPVRFQIFGNTDPARDFVPYTPWVTSQVSDIWEH